MKEEDGGLVGGEDGGMSTCCFSFFSLDREEYSVCMYLITCLVEVQEARS